MRLRATTAIKDNQGQSREIAAVHEAARDECHQGQSRTIKDNQGRSHLPDGAVHEAARDDCRVGRGDEGPPCVNRQGVKRLSRRRRRQSEV